MTFTSFYFFLFSPLALLLYYLCPSRARFSLLVAASYIFYATQQVPYLLGVLLLSTLLSFGLGLAMQRTTEASRRRSLLWLGVVLQLAVLVFLRYTAFFATNLNMILEHWTSSLRLDEALFAFASVGVSYYVFAGISYLLDIYWEIGPVETRLDRFFLFMCFFPKLLQGPIERARSFLPQLDSPLQLDRQSLLTGLQLFGWGLFKKVVIADRLALLVNTVYQDVHHYQGLPLFIATYLFAFQLYFDFSGYTDMALGTARLFNIKLTDNFNAPYQATSVADFWRRWHISFSSWILDYIFKPLQINLRDFRTWGTPLALLCTFLISGLWHGPTWCYIFWGLLHGLFMAAAVLYQPWQKKLYRATKLTRSRLKRPWQMLITFHLICLAWIFFRASSIADGWYVARASWRGLPASLAALFRGDGWAENLFLGQPAATIFFAVGLICFAGVVGAYRRRAQQVKEKSELSRIWRFFTTRWVKTIVYALMAYLIFFHGAQVQSFIYVQF